MGNHEKLQALEAKFFARYPGGFDDPELVTIIKKHNVPKLAEHAQEAFARHQFGNHNAIIEAAIKIVSTSSMVSLFEKPRFRDGINALSGDQRHQFVDSLFELLHGDAEGGFNVMRDLLVEQKLAKWTLISALPFYYATQRYWFIKPNTTKAILKHFGKDEEIVYKPRPYYAFYRDYSAFLNTLKKQASASLSTNNAGFTGFLMMTA